MVRTSRPNAAFRGTLGAMLVALSVSACGTPERSKRLLARDAFAAGDVARAESLIRDPEVAGKDVDRLLTYLDLAMTAHQEGKLERSAHYFAQAFDLRKRLYTESIRETLLSGLLNDTAQSYPGAEYEISYAHFYQTLNFLTLAQADSVPADSVPEVKEGGKQILPALQFAERKLTDRDRVQYLSQARAQLLAWDAFLSELKELYRGQAAYKDELLAKWFGAYVHHSIGRSDDLETARVLYEDVPRLFLKAYGLFRVYNLKAGEYASQYGSFESLGKEKVRAAFYSPTAQMTQIEAQAKKSQLALKSKAPSTLVLLESGMVPEKREKRYFIGINTLFAGIEDPGLRRAIEEIGFRVMIELAPKVGAGVFVAALAGAASSSGDEEPPIYLSDAIDRAIGFEFKLPVIDAPSFDVNDLPANQASLRLTDPAGRVSEQPLQVYAPIDEVAFQNVSKRASRIATKTAIRVGVKYLAALVAAIKIYQSLDTAELIRILVASGSFVAAKKIIDSTEAADIRAWNLLPARIYGLEVESASPPPKSAELVIRSVGAGTKVVPLDPVAFARKRPSVVKYRWLPPVEALDGKNKPR